ncbi:MAG: hypothetical protein PSX81_05490 [bacterium]|nr:hypothetical protein [bacterium]
MRKNFNWSGMKGEPVREDQLKFSMRGGFFATFLSKQKSKKKYILERYVLWVHPDFYRDVKILTGQG